MFSDQINDIWIYLSASPLFGLTATLIAYGIAWRVHQKLNNNTLANPVAISMIILIALLLIIDMPYSDFFEGAQFIHFLLGPATVALAIPLYRQMDKIKQLLMPLLIGIVASVFIGCITSVLIAKLFGADKLTWLSLAPKSVTSPIAMSITETIGGIPPLTAVMVIITGIIGAITCQWIFKLIRVDDEATRGIALGSVTHGIGTARAFQLSQTTGAFAGLSMALSAVANSLILPWLVTFF